MSDLEDDFNPGAHNTLLQAISGLKKTQHIRQITRNEPKIKQDEFELVKGTSVVTTQHVPDDTAPTAAVAVNDLVRVLQKKKKHLEAGKVLKNVQLTKKVLQKPLEKPVAERIKRQVGYDKVKTKLQRWDAVVSQNRTAEQQVFPLFSETVYINTKANTQPLQSCIKSDLRQEMEATEEKLRQLKREREGDFTNEADLEQRQNELHKLKLTRDELIARRKELAYLKMRESQQSAKARMRNKIKSKKYHKLLKRQKLQTQLKEFEQLQKTNPEAALEKLNELEKNRVLERATLRHKNTGSWAKNLQVRAKYDKDVRKDLAEQLHFSRELTQKSKISDDEESLQNGDNENENVTNEPVGANDEATDNDPNNPWLSVRGKANMAAKKNGEGQDENWRKYWMDRNRNDKLLAAYKTELNQANEDREQTNLSVEIKSDVDGQNEAKSQIVKPKPEKKSNNSKKSKFENGWLVEELDILEPVPEPEKEPKSKPKLKSKTKPIINVDDIFDAVEDRMDSKIQQKLNKLRKKVNVLDGNPRKRKLTKETNEKLDPLKNLKDLSFKDAAKRPLIDEELNNEEDKTDSADAGTAIVKSVLQSKQNGTAKENENANENKNTTTASTDDAFIDPKKFPVVALKQTHLQELTAAVEPDDFDDGDVTLGNHHMTITEAFEDDDIVADFGKEKDKDTSVKNAEIDLTMPGWGSWAGAGINEATQPKRSRRIVLKLAPENKRRDENKTGLYLNEESGKQLRPHLVSDLPFPFTSLADYEGSIRAPIGRTFVPETAFRMMTRPAVITRKGAIIEPMDESELSKKPKWSNNVVDKRISHASKIKSAVTVK